MLAAHLIAFYLFKPQEDPINKVDGFLRAMCLQEEQLKDVSVLFEAEMKKGLSSKSRARAAVKMLPTHVCTFPYSSEKGQFLALDLGDSNFKVQQIELGDAVDCICKEVKIQEKIVPIPNHLLNSRADELFNFVSRSLKQFMQEKNIGFVRKHPLAFTFSFPCEQPTLNQGLLVNWTKNVRTPGLQGRDVVLALKTAIERTGGMDIDIVALVNDSVATMMTCGFDDPECEVGLIIGSGTNACYMEERRHIDLVEGDEGRMCINSEWGAFGDDGALDSYITDFDIEIDAASTNPGKQSFEKMVSGMYLGELVRLAVLKMAKQGLLFGGSVSNALKAKGKITTTHLAAIEDVQRGLQNTRDILVGLDLTPSVEDCIAVQHVSTIVTKRSSNLVAACLSSILARIKQNRRSTHVTVGVDGELYRRHPQYSKRLQGAMQKLIPDICVRFVTSPCGTGTGAALITVGAKQAAWKRQQVDETVHLFKLSQEQLVLVKSKMKAVLESEMKTLPSVIYHLPNGRESGQYLGLELEKTRVRAVLVNIRNNRPLHHTNRHHKIYEVPLQRLHTRGEEFYDHVAQCISDFLDFVGMKNTCLPAALTVSFPFEKVKTNVLQNVPQYGYQCPWRQIGNTIKPNYRNTAGKEITSPWRQAQCTTFMQDSVLKATDCEGRDVVTMLREAIDRRATFDLDIVAVVNDTVGTMIACAYDDSQCEVGLIVGAGVNICYMEELKNIKYAFRKEVFTEVKEGDMTCAEETGDTSKQRICINTECGRLGENGSLNDIITTYDIQVDSNSLHPGKQRFEKLTSGLYVGEVVRQVLLDLSSRGLLFKDHENIALKTPGLFHINCLSQIESGRVGVVQVRSILQQLGLEISCDDSVFVKEVCCAVSHRAAQLCGVAVAAVVDQMRENRMGDSLSVTVAADGELYKIHPHFSRILKETVTSLAPECTVTFMTSEEGSGKGAALIAATARSRREKP